MTNSDVRFRALPRRFGADAPPGWEAALMGLLRDGDVARPNAAIATFEERFATYCGARHCIAVSSGTAALLAAYAAIGVRPGDQALSVPNTFVASVEPFLLLGGEARLAEVDERSFGIDVDAAIKAFTPRTTVVTPLHPYGRALDLADLAAECKKRGITVLEDCSHAHGAEIAGQRVGTMGDIAVFSFGPTKPFAGVGEGGGVITDSDDLAASVRLIAEHGNDGHNDHISVGLNLRIHPLEAAYLTWALTHLDAAIERRREIASRYNAAFEPLGIITNPITADRRAHSFYVYVIEVHDRERVRAALLERGVETVIHYPRAIHQLSGYRYLARPRVTSRWDPIQARIVSLPMYPELTDAEVDRTIETVLASGARGPHGERC